MKRSGLFGYGRRNMDSVKSRAAQMLQPLRQDRSRIQSRIQELQISSDTAKTPQHTIREIEAATENVKVISEEAIMALGQLTKKRMAAFRSYRLFCFLHGVDRDPMVPDVLMTIFLALLFLLVEGCATAALMIMEGRIDIVEGFAYGISFAAVNITCGLICGYFPLRYLTYKVNSPVPSPGDAGVRSRALAGLVVLLFLMTLLIFSAARTRAIGSHSGIFDFEAVSFFATFNDSIALAIIAIGVLGTIVSVWKGYCGLSDPVPGLAEMHRQASEAVDAEAEDLLEESEENILEVAEEAEEVGELAYEDHEQQREERAKQYAALCDEIRTHNDNVLKSKDMLRVFADDMNAAEAFVDPHGREAEMPPLNLNPFDQLMIDEALGLPGDSLPDATETQGIAEALSALASMRSTALSELRACYACFVVQAPDISSNPVEGESYA